MNAGKLPTDACGRDSTSKVGEPRKSDNSRSKRKMKMSTAREKRKTSTTRRSRDENPTAENDLPIRCALPGRLRRLSEPGRRKQAIQSGFGTNSAVFR